MNRTILIPLIVILILTGCASQPTEQVPADTATDPTAVSPSSPDSTDVDAASDEPRSNTTGDTSPADTVSLALDWNPNTNHTGLYVAQDQGYYREQGLEVEMLDAREGGSVIQLVASGQLEFGISYQENVTNARLAELPIVSIAAIIQHNTSGFASLESAGITRPADFAGKIYGAVGSPVEEAVIRGLMECDGGDFSQVKFVDIGSTDFFVATQRGDVDFSWIFEGWTGIEAQVRGVPLNIVMINDVDCIPDYYTPVLITSEQMIAEQPEIVERFMHATSAGYEFAIANPEQAADILIDAAPELDAELVRQSQMYLTDKYQAEAPRWGEQRTEIWRGYAEWMAERDLIDGMIDPEAVFTNEFLP